MGRANSLVDGRAATGDRGRAPAVARPPVSERHAPAGNHGRLSASVARHRQPLERDGPTARIALATRYRHRPRAMGAQGSGATSTGAGHPER